MRADSRALFRAGLPFLIALALGACASHPGHYYASDGPPDHVPPGLASVPDAEPRIEPVNPNANRPYVALGRSYTPDTSDTPFEQRGMASWYGRQYHGGRTASGEPYDMFAMSAAHPTLPIPSYARVTSVRDGRSVVVRVNDRGPFVQDRIIDLSYAAAVRLGIASPGSGEVIVKKLTARDIAGPAAPLASPTPAPVTTAAAAAVTTPAALAPPAPLEPIAAAPTALPAASAVYKSEQPPATTTLAADAPAATDSLAAPADPADLAGWSVQLGAFSVAANANALRDQVAQRLAAPDAEALPPEARAVRILQTGRLSRVLVGQLTDRKAAMSLARKLQELLARETTLYQH